MPDDVDILKRIADASREDLAERKRRTDERELLEEAGGGLAVVSVGYNTYGHPAEETLSLLEKYGFQVMRTDEEGTVEICLEREHG